MILKILFLKLGALGDLSFALPAPAFCKNIWPQCHFTWVVGKSVAEYLTHRPEIDQLVVVNDKNLFSKNKLNQFKASAELISKIDSRYDLILVAHRNLGYSLLLRPFVRGPMFQLSRKENSFWDHFGIQSVLAKPLVTHESHAIRDLVIAGAQHLKFKTDLNQWKHVNPAEAATFLPFKIKKYIVLQMGGAGNLKTEFRLKSWEHWSELVSLLLKNTDLNLVLIGAPSEGIEIEDILLKTFQNSSQHQERIYNFVGKTTILELEQIIYQAQGVVGIDSGPLHVADALRVPTLGLFGPSSTKSWGFIGEKSKALNHPVPCSPCYRDDGIFPICSYHHRCMVDLKAQTVFHALTQVFELNATS